MLILWTATATAAVVVLLLVVRAIRSGMGERAGIGGEPPGQVSAGPVVVAPLATGQGEAA